MGESPLSARYVRQSILPEVGRAGQERLAVGRVLVVGLGALGSVVAELLARAGVGHLTLLDRDVVELSNLQRQTLYCMADIGDPKAEAAAARLGAVNPEIGLDPKVTDLNSGNVVELLSGASLVVDATDNAQTRYLVNDASLETGTPWVYGGAVGTEGRVTAFRPLGGGTADEGRSSGAVGGGRCLRCLFPSPPSPGELPTCDTAGVLNTATATIGALQAQLAIRMLVEPEWVPEQLWSVDLWSMRFRSIELSEGGEGGLGCETCVGGRREFLRTVGAPTVSLCGRETLQVLPPVATRLDLGALAERLRATGRVERSRFLLRFTPSDRPESSATIFPDGRLLLHGPHDLASGRAWYDRLIGT